MIDFSDVDALLRKYCLVLAAVVVLFLAALLLWLFRGYGGKPEVAERLNEIKQSAKVTEQRVENIIEANKAKESEAKHEVSKIISSVSDDALPDVLSGLLEEFRKQR